jgi:DNA invertase Pin-like site-specific DNA recombinase
MHTAIYRRYSTSRQGDGATLEVQEEQCRAFAAKHGWDVVEVFDDTSQSGAFFERPGLLAALAAAERDEIEVLIALDHDRFSRGVWAKLVEAAEDVGLRLVTSDGAIDTADDENEFTADVLDAVAKKYRKQQTRKSMASRAHRVKNGNWVGGVPPFGHRIVKTDRGSVLDVNSDEQLAVLRAFELMLDERCSPTEAASRLNAEGYRKRGARWNSRSLVQTLSRETLAGRFVYGKERRAKTKYDAARYGIEGHVTQVPPVVSPERFEAMSQLLAGVKWTKKTSHVYPLSGRITTHDGHAYTGRFDTSNRKRRYRCRERYEYCRAGSESTERCTHKELSADKLDLAVWWAVIDHLNTERLEELFELHDPGPTDAEAAAEAKERLTRQLTKLRDERVNVEARALRDGYSLAATEKALAEIDADVATAEAELAAAESWFENAVRRESQRQALDDYVQLMAAHINTPNVEMMQRVYEAFDLRVTLSEDGNTCEVEVGLPLGGLPLDVNRRSLADV